MLHIVLMILKIIGIILLVLIGLILLLLACVLFVPVRYGAYVKYDQIKGSQDIKVKVTYLLHIVTANFYIKDKKLVKELRLFGIKTGFLDKNDKNNGDKNNRKRDKKADRNDKNSQIGNDNNIGITKAESGQATEEKKEDLFDEIDVKKTNSFINRTKRRLKRRLYKRKKAKEAKQQSHTEEDDYLGIYETERDLRDLDNVEVIESNFFKNSELAEKNKQKNKEKGTLDDTKEADTEKTTKNSDLAKSDNADENIGNSDTDHEEFVEEEKKNLFSFIKFKITEIFRKIKYQITKICGTIRKVFENIRKLCSRASDIRDMINDENNRLAFTFVKGEAVKVIRHIRPRTIKGYIKFGLDDPYNTGRILGIIYAFLRRRTKKFEIIPDFDNKVIETDMQVKGRIQVYYLLIIAYRIYKNENFKKALAGRRRKNG